MTNSTVIRNTRETWAALANILKELYILYKPICGDVSFTENALLSETKEELRSMLIAIANCDIDDDETQEFLELFQDSRSKALQQEAMKNWRKVLRSKSTITTPMILYRTLKVDEKYEYNYRMTKQAIKCMWDIVLLFCSTASDRENEGKRTMMANWLYFIFESIASKSGFFLDQRTRDFGSTSWKSGVESSDPVVVLERLINSKQYLTKPISDYRYSLSDDLGIRELVVGNASGEPWRETYHCFKLKKDDIEIASVGFAVHLDYVDYLLVAVLRGPRWYNSLQLRFHKFLEKSTSGKMQLFHDGTLTVGREGAASKEDVVGFIETIDPFLLDKAYGKRIELGDFPQHNSFTFDNPILGNLLLRTAIYAYDREIYRKKHKEIKTKQRQAQIVSL